MIKTTTTSFFLLLLIGQIFSQTTYTSNGSGNFRSISWTPSTPADFNDIATDSFIIRDGDAVTLASDITIASLQIGEGGAASSFVFGDGTATARALATGSLIVQSNGTLQVDAFAATHTLSATGDIINNGGTFDLDNGSGLVNTTLANSATSVLSGSTMIFNDLTASGGGGVILIASIDVNGNFVADASGTDITTSVNHNFDGDFTLTNSATFTATSSTQTFDGAGAQAIGLSGGSASFNALTFDNSTKTVTGDIVSSGTFRVTDDAVWSNTGGDHSLDTFQVENASGVSLTGGSITFVSTGTIRFGTGGGTDGTITLGSGTNIIIEATTFIERDDIVVIDGDMEITATGQFVINGIETATGTEMDAQLNVTGTRTLTIRDQGDLYVRGNDNFPTGFTTYVLEKSSLVRYDSDFNQTIRSENSANTTIIFGRLYLAQSDASAQRTRTLSALDDDLIVQGQFDMVNGVMFSVVHTANLTFGEDVRADDGATAGSPIFSAPESTITMDADINQVVDGPVAGSYDVDSWIITNSAIPTTTRTVFVDDNIAIDVAFTILNPNGTSANTLIVDLDDNQIFGVNGGIGESFTLGANTTIYSSTNDIEGFAEDFGDGGDVISINANSIVRFDRAGDQTLPNFNGGTFGTIQFTGSGNRFIPANGFTPVPLIILGDVTRVGGTPVFRFGSLADVFQATVNHSVAGDWNLATAYTGDDENNGGAVDATITFNGGDQIISASDFGDVVFAGTGTKTITGTLLIDGDLTVNDAVTVNAGSEAIDIEGNWTENGTATFTQTGSTTDFLGGGTQTIVQVSGSTFNDLDITNNTTVDINSTVQVGRDLDIADGSDINIEGQTIRVSRDLRLNSTATVTYTTPSTSIIIMDGSTEQDLRNINAAQNFPTLQFEGVGNKELVNNILTIEGDFSIANESTFQANSREINFEGSNWSNGGNFLHNNSVNFLNAGGTSNVSTSSFHDIEIGMSDGTVTTTVNLTGNITLSGEMNIFANGRLDVSASDYAVTVEEDWNNYGIFNARNGNVTFTGGESDFRTLSLTVSNTGVQADKAFYDLTVNTNPGSRFDVEQEGVVLNDQIDVLNDLTITTGIFRLVEDDGDADPGPALLNVGGSLVNNGNGFEFRQAGATIVMNGTSGSHSIDLGGDAVRSFEINAPGASYVLTDDFQMEDATAYIFTLSDGTLDLNGSILTVNRGGLDMTGGTMIVNEGASLLLNDLAADPDFNKTGGTLQIVGELGTPATLSSTDVGGFTFTQTSGDIAARYYTIANTRGDGLRIEGGTINTAATSGYSFSDGTFTSGADVAYLTLANIALGTTTATNVIFNSGPTNNVAVGTPNPASGTFEFFVSGGSLAGAQDELDVPDGGAASGFIRWNEDDGFTWNGSVSSAWDDAGNWDDTSGDGDGVPDSDDIIYIHGSTPNDPVITAGEVFSVARITVRNSGNLSFTGDGSLSVGGNFTVFSGSTVDMSTSPTSTLNVAGAWANAGTFNEGTATVTFNGTSGASSITTLGDSDPFYNLTIDGVGATYTLGSILNVSNAFTLSDGTFDASSGFDIFINNDWSVNGGIFDPGQGRVRFDGTSGTQSISGGTMWDVRFEGASLKSIDGNISIADDVEFVALGGIVSANDMTIFVGGDWDLDVTNGFDPGTGTVIFNGTAGQNLEADDNQALTFNDIIFQNAGAKDFEFTTMVTGDMSIISENTFVDMEAGSTLAITGTLSQTGGNFRIFDSNFPTAGAYDFIGGEVDFLQNVALSIPGGIEFNDLEIRSLSGGVVATVATLGGDITVKDDINFSTGAVELVVGGNTITLGDAIFLSNDETLTWGGGTLVHTGAFWNMDADFNTTTRAFENLTLGGTAQKRPNSDIAVNGNLTVLDGVNLQQLTRAISNDGDGILTMQQNTIVDNRVVGTAFPTGFATYVLDETSRVDLRATGNQTLFTNGGTLEYGGLRIYTTGTVTLDGALTVLGDFDMNSNPTLADGGFDITLNGAINDIQDYTPSAGRTITFGRTGDQLIADYDGSGLDLEFVNVVFGGSGTKTLLPNAADEVTDIDGTVTINSGVTVATARGIDFSGASWTNNGTFNLTVTSRPFVFTGSNATVDPGTNDIAAMTVSNSGGTVTIQNNGLNLGTATFTLSAGAVIDFGSLTHTLSSADFLIDATANWILTGSTLDFDRNTTQLLPIIDQANANITGVPSIITSNAGVKRLTGNTVVNDVTIGVNTDLDVDATSNYQLTVNGNWGNSGGDLFEREGTIIFNSDDTDAKTIDANGEDFAAVTFQGSAIRTYELQSDMQVEGNTAGTGLTLASATLDLNGNTLTLGDNDTSDPDAELNVIGLNGRLEVDAGATLQFDTNDDGGDVVNTEIGGNLDVQSGGVLSIVGVSGDVATVTRSAGFERIDINIESGAEIEAQYYSMQYLTDEGLEVEDGATIDAVNNFSNGSFSNLETDTGNHLISGGDDNEVVTGNRYLTIESDAALTIANVTFNFGGTPIATQHYNVTRSADGSNGVIDWNNTSGPLGRTGFTYEQDLAGGSPPESTGNLTWDLPLDTQWTGGTSTDWSTASNWDNGVPSIASNDREAIIELGSPFNPTIETGDGVVNISALIIGDGILKVISSGALDLDGDLVLGDGTGGALIMDNTSTISVEGSWTTSASAIFDNGEGTVSFDAASGGSVSISPGDQSFHNLSFTNAVTAGEFNLVTAALDVNGNLIIENSATVIPSTAGYNYTIAGNITETGGTFDTGVDGEIILDGAAQTVTDASFDELTVSGTGTKTTAGAVVINDNLIIESGVTFSGGGAITLNGDVNVDGTFNGVTSQTYTMNGDDWIAAPSSYTGEGTVLFNRSTGTQFISQSTDGDNPVQFHNLTFGGSAQMFLGRLIGGDQSDGNVDLTGSLTVNNTINTLRCNDYLIDNTSGTGTFTMQTGEFIYVLGADNFPSGFATYALDDNSTVRYWGTIDQSIRGGVEYGNVDLNNTTTKTLGGNVDIDGNLIFRNSTLDASGSNYSINLAGRWDTNNGNDDGSFEARAGTVTFDGAISQTLDIGETGTQAFNDILVNKSGGNVEVATSNMTIGGNINVFNGTFDANNLIVSISGNMNASGTGVFSSGGIGLYYLNATSGTPSIGTNGSSIAGDVEIDAAGRTYELVDNLTLLGGFTLTAGTLDVNGQTLSVGNFQDVVDIFGILNVSTTSKPGGTLALGNDVQLVVNPGGEINLVGTGALPARVTSTGITDYVFTVTGTAMSPGRIGARNYIIEYVGVGGVYVNANTTINTTNNFSDGIFQNGFSGGKYLRIENDQDLSGGNRIENIVFDDNPGGGAVNLEKATATSGSIEVFNYSGGFSGDDFDNDPNDQITWLAPPTVTWTGTVSNDWFTIGNWDSGTIPTASQDVVIPNTLNEPIIDDNGLIAVANNLTIEVNAIVKINTPNADGVDLQIAGDLTFEASARFESSGANDNIEIGGSWIRQSTALVDAGTSQITFNSVDGSETIDNSDEFYDLVLNLTGSAVLATDLTVGNDLTITAGTLDLSVGDLTVIGNLMNSGTISPQTKTVFLIPNNTTIRTIDLGTSELYNLTIGELAGSAAEYDLSSDLTVNHDFNLIVGTLDPNTNNLNFGNSDAVQDDINIAGTILVEANEAVALGDDAVFLVQSGGDVRFNGTNTSNVATLTRRTTGSYDFTVESGGTFEASNFLIEHMEDEGIWVQFGATLVSLSSGTFQNGSNASYYLRLSNDLGVGLTATEITINTGPTNNIRRNEAAGSNLILEDASGAFAGPSFELDDGVASTGEVQWSYTNTLTVWTGTTDSNWNDASNWNSTIPTSLHTVQIPDVSGVSGNFPIIDNTSLDGDAASLTIFSGASLTINDNRSLTVADELSNSGTLTISGTGTIEVGDSWTNNGTFNPGNSTITLSSDTDVTVSGGASFYNLVIDGEGASGTGNGIVFSSSEMLDVNNNFTITDGVYQVADAAHTLNVGGNFAVDATNGSFIDNVSTVTLDGAAQNIGDASGATIEFNNLTLSGSGIKTVLDQLDIAGDLSIGTGTTLAFGNESITFAGNSLDIDGTIDVSGGTSTMTFDGSQIQVITGNAGSADFDNIVINNTAAGNNDIQLNIDVSVNDNADFALGVVQSSGSNPLTFTDGSTVSYDGSEETSPITFPGTDVDANSYAVGPVVKIGDDDFIFPIGEGSRIGRLGISAINAALATDQYSAEYVFGAEANASATRNGGIERVSGLEYWDLSNLNAHGGQPQVTLFWGSTSDVTNPATLAVAHYNSMTTSWDNQGNGGTTGVAAGGTITSSINLTSFSPITLATTDLDDNPLPVELLDFYAEVEDNVVALHWSTASELNNDRFNIYRSLDGLDFELRGSVDGNGNSSNLSEYTLVDGDPIAGVSYYKLVQVDFDGTNSELGVVRVSNNFYQSGIETTIYPNPTSLENLNLNISTGDGHTPVSIELVDLNGRIYYRKTIEPQFKLSEKIEVEGQLSSGIYFLNVRQGENVSTSRVIVQ